MKNFLILGLLAALLFSVSAGLSLWQNQSKKEAEAGEKDKEKAASKHPAKPEAKEPPETHAPPKAGHAPGTAPAAGPDSSAILADRESRLRLRSEQVEMVLRDLQVERQVIENMLKQVNAELKNVSNRSTELEAVAADLERKRIEFNATEKQNITKMATMYDSMPPENAAPILKQMADSGKMDTAVKILAQMKDRQAARILAELNDASLAAQLLDKMRLLKPTPAPGTVPAGGPPPAKTP
jgi:flagellar motility protein MotE (MotC chaperone)